MTVRQRMDQLLSDPATGDFDVSADQRSVAALMIAVKFLADSIDELETNSTGHGGPDVVECAGADPGLQELTAQVQNMTEQIEELADQVSKLAKALKKLAKNA